MPAFKKIRLTQGKFALVDAEDFERVSAFRWAAHWDRRKKAFYARRSLWFGKKAKPVMMHRIILDAPRSLLVDHVNGNTLDNRRLNIRVATSSQNSCNRRNRTGSRSRYKGVYCHRLKWRARIMRDGVRVSLGTFDSERNAAMAYDQKASELHGEFALLNFPKEKQCQVL